MRFVPRAVLPGFGPTRAAGRSHAAAERLDLRRGDGRQHGSRQALAEDEDVDHWSTYVGRGAIRFYLPLNVQLANPFFGQVVVVAKDFEARERLHATAREAAGRGISGGRRARLAAGARPAGRLAAAVSRERSGQGRGHADRAAARRVMAASSGTRQVNFDWMEPARQLRVRIDQDAGAAARRQLGQHRGVLNAAIAGTTVTQVRDDIYLVNVVARAIDRGARRARHAALAAGADSRRADGAAQPVRHLRVRPGIPAGVAPRPRADADRARRRRARRAAGCRGRRARAADRRARRQTLPQGYRVRSRRHRRGKRRRRRPRCSRWCR